MSKKKISPIMRVVYSKQNTDKIKQKILSGGLSLWSTEQLRPSAEWSWETVYDASQDKSNQEKKSSKKRKESLKYKIFELMGDLSKSLIFWCLTGIVSLFVFLFIGHFTQSENIWKLEIQIDFIKDNINDLKSDWRISDQDYKTMMIDIATLKEKIKSVDDIQSIKSDIININNELKNINLKNR